MVELKDYTYGIDRVEERQIVIYGAGILGKLIYKKLVSKGVDNIFFCDWYKAGERLFGKEVLHPSALLEKKDSIDVILTIIGNGFFDAAKILVNIGIPFFVARKLVNDIKLFEIEDMNLKKEISACKHQYKSTLKKYYLYHNIVSNRELLATDITVNSAEKLEDFHQMTLVVTDRCTLKCEKCSAFTYRYVHPQDVPYEKMMKDFSRCLECIDYLNTLVIVGGETLLYKDLVTLLYACENNPRIVRVFIPTNGTVLPGEELLKAMAECNVQVMISSYNVSQNRGRELELLLLNHGIEVIYRQDEFWSDLADCSYKEYSEEEVKNIFTTCQGRTCWNFKNGILSPCGVVIQKNELKLIPKCNDDYVDFSDDNIALQELKNKFSKLLTKPFLEACRYCNGNSVRCEVAHQLE